MEIIIDKRIELMTIVQTLCNYWENLSTIFGGESPYQCKYKDNIKSYFEKYQKHEVILLYNILANDIMNISAFLNLALCYSDPPELNNIADYESNFRKISDSAFPFEEFIGKLRQFYIDTDFEKFYESNKDEYARIINGYSEKSELSVNNVFDYYGNKAENYNVIISPLVVGCFGINVKTKINGMANYSIICPWAYKEGKYLYGSANNNKGYLWHEIGHLTINDLTSNYINDFNVEKIQIQEIFVKNCYVNVETIIIEYIIRAITIRQFEINGENEYAEFMVQRDIQKGFVNIVSVKEHIKENYEENNKFVKDNRYKNLMEYVITKI